MIAACLSEDAMIALDHAMLCAECETVIRRASDGRCTRCGSDATLDLSVILNRETPTRCAPLPVER